MYTVNKLNQTKGDKMKTLNKVYSSSEILQAEDLYGIQDKACSSGMSIHYAMTPDEMGWLDFIAEKYSIWDYITNNLNGNILTIDAMEISQAMDDDCGGWGKAVMLSDETALQKILFWVYIESEGEYC